MRKCRRLGAIVFVIRCSEILAEAQAAAPVPTAPPAVEDMCSWDRPNCPAGRADPAEDQVRFGV